MVRYIALASAAALVLVDQLIKLWAQSALKAAGYIKVIPGLFNLTYVENYGAAFGILKGRTALLVVVVTLVIASALYVIFSRRITSNFLVWSISLVIAGGAGNLIDRIVRGYVIDYLDFSALFGFPVFNFADCCVVAGTVLILIFVVFLDKSGKEEQSVPQSEQEV